MKDTDLLSLILRKDANFFFAQMKKDLADLSRYLIEDNPDGLTEYQSDVLRAVFELGQRAYYANKRKAEAPVIRCSYESYIHFENLSMLDHEELWAMYLSKNGKVLEKKMISSGGLDSSVADMRQIVQPAIRNMAASVVLIHNHPHSTTRPSKQDRDVTNAAYEALRLFNINLNDHIIVSDHQYYSFRDNGDL